MFEKYIGKLPTDMIYFQLWKDSVKSVHEDENFPEEQEIPSHNCTLDGLYWRVVDEDLTTELNLEEDEPAFYFPQMDMEVTMTSPDGEVMHIVNGAKMFENMTIDGMKIRF